MSQTNQFLKEWSISYMGFLHVPKHTLTVSGARESASMESAINTLRPRQNGRYFPDDSFKWILLNKNVWISIEVSLKFVPKGSINNIPALVQIMAWRRPGDKPLFEPMMISLLTHICVTRSQWVNTSRVPGISLCYHQMTGSCLFKWLTLIPATD